MSELQGIVQIAQIAQGLTVTGLLLLIVWAFYTGRVVTTTAAEKIKVEAVAGKDRELLLVVAERDREREEKGEWKSVALELLQAARGGVTVTRDAVETLKRSKA